MKKLMYFILACLPLFGQAQDKTHGIRFEQNLSWPQVKAKAKAEHKYIFVDCYATWCGPCKNMDLYIYPNDTIGNFANEQFISIKVQMDTSKFDNEGVKNFYADAAEIKKTYQVAAFPTFLFFSPDGEFIHKATGFYPKKDFLSLLANALNPAKEYYSLLKKYRAGDRSIPVIQNLVPAALKLNERAIALEAADAYVSSLEDPFKKENIDVIINLAASSTTKAFQFVLNNFDRIDAVIGDKNRARTVVVGTLNYETYLEFEKDHKGSPDWIAVKKSLEKKAPEIADQVLLNLKIQHAVSRKQFNEYWELQMDYYDGYFSKLTGYDIWGMNNTLMGVFNFCSDKVLLTRAAKWSKVTIKDNKGNYNPEALDTYANLLYKSGQVSEAEVQEQKAIEVLRSAKKIDENEVKEDTLTLNKMKQHVPTWNTK